MAEIRFAPGLVPVLKHGRHNQKDHAGKGRARSDDEIAGLAQQRAGIGKVLDKSVIGEDGYGYVSTTTGERFATHHTNPTGAARVIAEQGWDAPAQSVDQETFDRLAQRDDLVTVYRGGPTGLERGMIEGTPFIGDGKIGPGTYVSTERDRAASFAQKWVKTGVDESGRPTYDVYGGDVVPMLMPVSMFSGAPNGQRSIAFDPITDHGLNGVGAVSGFRTSDRIVWNTGAMIVGPPAPVSPGDRDFVGRWSLDDVSKSLDEPPTDGEMVFYRIADGEATLLTDSGGAEASVIKFAPGLTPVIKFNPRQPRAKDGRWTKGGAAWGGDFVGSPFEPSPAEIDYRQQMANIDYIMGRSAFPPDYSYEGLPPPTVTLRQLGREQVTKVRRKIKKWKEARERRYLENLSDEKRAKLIAANRARVDAKRAARGLPPVVYKAMDPVLPLLYDVFRDVVDDPFVWIALIQDQRPLSEVDGDLGAILDDMLDAVAPAETVIKFAPGLRPVLKHGSHNQKDHAGKNGGAREVQVSDNQSAWNAVLTDEARALDDRMKAHPDRYNPWGQRDYGLKDGATETRIVRQDGPPRVRDYETNTSAGLSMTEAMEVDGSLGVAVSGYGKPLVPVGAERPPQHVYRVMSTQEFDAARERGYIKSDERMNLATGEGTVTSLRSTGSFYNPTDGSDYRVVRIKYADEDGWQTDLTDGYIKTQDRVPFDRVDLFTSPVSQSVTKHLGGKHDQKTHGRGGQQTLMDAPFDEWGEDRAPRIRRMEKVGPSAEQIKAAMLYEPDEGVISEYIFAAYGEEINRKVEDYRDNTPGVSEDDVELFRSQLENQYYRVHRDEAEEYEKSSYQEALKEDFAEVYNVSHTGLDRNGRELTITSTTETVTLDSWDESVKVEGTLRGRYEDGTSVELGKFERTFSRSVMTSDGIEVEHDWFRIDEPDARGTGFGREFIQRQEDYYISKGVDRITVHAALEDGGYTWARAGFDWNPVHENPLGTVRSRLNAFVADEKIGPVKTGLQQLQSRLDGDRSSPDYPTPNEIATWGYRDGQSMWPGREIMGGDGNYYGSSWHGQKILTPNGIRETGRETLPVGTPTRKK